MSFPEPAVEPRVCIGATWRRNAVVYRRALRLCTAEYVTHRMPILVYQMGKVGSTSILRSLRRHGIGPVFRIHMLSAENLHLVYPSHVGSGHPVICVELFENLLEVHLPPVACPDRLTTHELEAIFLRQMRHSVALDWFDLEMQPALGIDVYAHLFPRDTRHFYTAGEIEQMQARWGRG